MWNVYLKVLKLSGQLGVNERVVLLYCELVQLTCRSPEDTFARLHNMQKFQPRTCYNVALLYICSCDVVQMKWRLELSNCGRLEVWKYLNLTPETQFEAKLSLLCQFRNNFSASRSNKVYSVSGLWKAAGGAKLTVGWQ